MNVDQNRSVYYRLSRCIVFEARRKREVFLGLQKNLPLDDCSLAVFVSHNVPHLQFVNLRIYFYNWKLSTFHRTVAVGLVIVYFFL